MTTTDVRWATVHGAVMAALILGGLALLGDVHGWGEVAFALVAGVVSGCAELVRARSGRRPTRVPDSTA